MSSSESRLYTFSPETKEQLRKFRLGTSRHQKPQATVCFLADVLSDYWNGTDQINKETLEIAPAGDEVFDNLEELADELPDHSPRFVLLSYPITLASGRQSVPYVLLYYLPVTCNAELRMLYAGSKELMRNTAEAGKVLELESTDDLVDIPSRLGAGGE